MFNQSPIFFTTNKGNQIIVRLPQVGDLDQMLSFINELITEDAYIAVSHRGTLVTREEEERYLTNLLHSIGQGRQINLLGFVEGKLIATCSLLKQDKRKEHVGMVGIGILQGFRSEGIGTKLLEIIFEKAKEIGLKILELKVYHPNLHAIRLYEKLGFVQVGRGIGMIRHKDKFIDEIWMQKNLE